MNRSPRQRGIALVAAVVLAMLYFGLIQLLLIDGTRDLREAQRFRARIVALTLAENAVELAAQDLVNRRGGTVPGDDWQGTYSGTLMQGAPSSGTGSGGFMLRGVAETKGTVKVSASVRVFGRVEGNEVKIHYTMHSQ